jgi:hypothetical protein
MIEIRYWIRDGVLCVASGWIGRRLLKACAWSRESIGMAACTGVVHRQSQEEPLVGFGWTLGAFVRPCCCSLSGVCVGFLYTYLHCISSIDSSIPFHKPTPHHKPRHTHSPPARIHHHGVPHQEAEDRRVQPQHRRRRHLPRAERPPLQPHRAGHRPGAGGGWATIEIERHGGGAGRPASASH